MTKKRVAQKFSPRVQQAADQMWDYVRRGVTFEVPAALSTDDLTTRAVLCLQQKHPECPVTMLQSRVVVVGRMKAQALVSPEAMKLLESADYVPEPEKAINPVAFIEQQKDFMLRSRADPEVAVRRAQLEQAARDGIVLSPEEKIFAQPKPSDEPAPVIVLPPDIAPGAEP